ncbi:hypothetical protein K7A41_02885 [Sphingobacterium sp. InxBP1]|uniref:hypothetical protein n=1 Tax=Sphingobacterium sp. InxBP1 TaxID=2870328 RepID=UPI0022431FD7|nr:hypothetical protein [Sphingobacterium sp. InxBP1]MCW8310164.1 hypothetical protein [Sphingobacterium sp. InxBP1]
MDEKALLTIEIENFAEYVKGRKIKSGLPIGGFADMVDVAKGEISKIINKKKKGVSIHSFYKIAVHSGDIIENVIQAVYTHRNLELKTGEKVEERSNFGIFMRDEVEVEGQNGFDFILNRTGIDKKRLTDIYYNGGSPEPYELILIEKATGRETGELMKKFVTKYPIKKRGV